MPTYETKDLKITFADGEINENYYSYTSDKYLYVPVEETSTNTTTNDLTKKEILLSMQKELKAISGILGSIAFSLLPIAVGVIIAIFLAVAK